jgi:DNA-binding CsgD family transcriptional regulator
MLKTNDPFNRCKKLRHNPRKGKKWPIMPRQQMILHLYNARLKTNEVAEIMGITKHTLYKHLDRIYYKLDVSSRDEAIEKEMRNERIRCKLESTLPCGSGWDVDCCN